MKVNRSTFSTLKQQYEIKLMASAYILAERTIIEENSKGNDLTGSDAAGMTYIMDWTDPENFHFTYANDTAIPQPMGEKEKILAQAVEVRLKLDKAIEDEDYVKAKMWQNVLDGLEKKYNEFD